ncbi:endonuclease G [Naegleria gruberi]|uniref:Endonuclease G n=1 Tax=Naegleria gruberi TaxID=5762 RepID=D2V494_NAEGR|nr:endonuclease G [Naegleria gruberi]EFC48480.1 endonuclease G [Naegleria gruberi]|eukprot:XP_002681224.1 endonuclease G [Naegleria gruberi]
MKRFGALLFTSTCSLGAGYYFGYRHQEVKRPSPTISTRSDPIITTATNLKPPSSPLQQEISSPQVNAGVDQRVESLEKQEISSTDQKEENNTTSTIETNEKKKVTTLEEIYQYLESKSDDSIHWPKYNIHLLSDDTEENREDTIKLFKTFDGFGIPTHAGALHLFSHFISVSDSRMRIPLYVAWSIPHLHDGMKVTADRKFSRFTKGSFYDNFTDFNPNNQDYLGSGYSRGHLVNCGDFNFFDQTSMNNTHLLIHNIVPQDFKNNAGYWLRMERFTRSLAYDFDSVHVIAGPAMIPEMFERKEVNGRLQTPKGIMKHLVVGKHQVAVPTHLFRIIIAEKHVDNQPEYYAQAFLVPNTELEKTDLLTKYSISLQELESVTGLKFLDKLAKSGNMFPLCKLESRINEETIGISNDIAADKPLEPTTEIPTEPTLNLNTNTVKYGCDCISVFPPWQDLDIQEMLWKKNITQNEIEEKWNYLVETTKWAPSKDITDRKRAKLEELKRNVDTTTNN